MSSEVTSVYEALAKAQGEFPVIPKDKEVEVKKDGRLLYTFMYADLTTIINCTRPSLLKHGLGFTQDYDKDRGLFFTRFIHSSGHFDTGHIPFAPAPNLDMKTVAGLFTYVKRISLTAALGVSADEDVDAAHDESLQGNSSSRVQHGPKPSNIGHHAPTPEELNALDQMDRDPAPLPPSNGAPKAAPVNVNEPGDYIVPMGVHKGKSLAEVGVHNAVKTIEYFKNLDKKSGKASSATLKQFERMTAAYTDQERASGPRPMDLSEEIPFF